MAQKLYLTNSAAAVAPQYSPTTGGTPPVIGSGGWEDTAVATRHALSLTKAGASVSVSRAETSTNDSIPTDPDNFDVLFGQWISPPLTNSGTVSNLGLAWLFAGSADGAGLVTRCLVKIVSGDGGTVRGYLTNNQGPSAFTSTPTGFRIEIPPPPPTANRELDFTVGDRVVVELGYRATNTTASPVTGTMWYGGTGADLAPGGTDTGLPPFVELSDVLVFGTEPAEIDGTAQALLGGLTATATGDRLASGTASSALGALVATALGQVTAEVITGQAVATLGPLTAQATADVAVTATAQAQLGGLLATADGTVVVTGAATALLGALLAGANASGSSSGTAQALLGALTATALGEVTAEVITASAQAQLGALAATATGSGLVPTISGTAQAQLGGLSAAVLADVLVPALAAAQLGALLASTAGRRTRHGFTHALLGPLVAAVLVTPPVVFGEMSPATVPGPAMATPARSGPTMKGA